MTTYGLEERHLKIIRDTFDIVFNSETLPKIYIFGSRAIGSHKKFSDIDLAFKSKKSIEKKLDRIKDMLQDSDLPYKVDLVEWNKIIPEYKNSINEQKRLFWSEEQQEKKIPWRVCPLGEHWVHRHPEISKSGKIGDWDGHCRTNPSKKDILKSDEIDIISESKIFKNSRPKVTSKNLGFANGNDYNKLISGWTAYWNFTFKPNESLHPNYIKALIASESSFNSNIKAQNRLKVGDAQGLLQLTEQTQKILKDTKGELGDHFVYLRKKDIWDPNKNIAAAVRWIFRKRETAKARIKREPNWEEVMYEYKGILNQNNQTARRIKNDYKKYLKELDAQK